MDTAVPPPEKSVKTNTLSFVWVLLFGFGLVFSSFFSFLGRKLGGEREGSKEVLCINESYFGDVYFQFC